MESHNRKQEKLHRPNRHKAHCLLVLIFPTRTLQYRRTNSKQTPGQKVHTRSAIKSPQADFFTPSHNHHAQE